MSSISTSETGHAKITANLNRLNNIAKRNSSVYKPTNAKLKTAAIDTGVATGETLVNNVSPVGKAYTLTVNKRKNIFEPVNPTATAAYNHLCSLDGVDKGIISKAGSLLKRLKGTNQKAETTTDDPDPASPTTINITKKSHSVSQQSFDMRAKNLKEFIDVLKLVPQYAPEEDELKIASLTTLANSLVAINKQVDADYSPYATALNLRDVFLYAPETGLVDTAKKMKSYIKSVSKISKTDKEEAAGIPFKKPAKKDLFL